jgi:hypothetical protein
MSEPEVKEVKGGSCGCSGGNLMSGGSGYGFNARSAPMMLGPYSGYGAIDPYRAETFDRPLTYPPLVSSMLGGKKGKRSARRSTSRRSKKVARRSISRRSHKVSNKKMSRKGKRVTFSRRNNALRRSGRRIRKSKKRVVKGGSLSFSDFAPSAGAAPSGSQNISSSPYYEGDVSQLESKMSALANPIPIKAGNNCGK